MNFQFYRFFLGFSYDPQINIKIGIRKRVSIFNKRKQEWQLISKIFVVDIMGWTLETGFLLN